MKTNDSFQRGTLLRDRFHLLHAIAAAALLLGGWVPPTRADILYLSLNNATIEKFTPSGVGSVFASTGLSGPYGLAFDSAGNIYAANGGNNTIEKFTPGGSASVFASTGLSGPAGLAFDSGGNLYAANGGNNTIEKFSPTGTDLGVFANSTTGANSHYLAFTNDAGVPLQLANQVPEPASCALLAFGAAAFFAFRRSKTRRGA